MAKGGGGGGLLPERLANTIIGVITGVWVANFLAPFVLDSYETSETINAIFMAIVGGLFALKGRGSNGSKGGGDARG